MCYYCAGPFNRFDHVFGVRGRILYVIVKREIIFVFHSFFQKVKLSVVGQIAVVVFTAIDVNPDSRFNGTADPKRYPRYFGWFRQWRDCAHYTQHYYQIKDAPILAINNHIKVLGLTGLVDPKEVLEELNEVKPPANGWDAKTFLHAGHVTKE